MIRVATRTTVRSRIPELLRRIRRRTVQSAVGREPGHPRCKCVTVFGVWIAQEGACEDCLRKQRAYNRGANPSGRLAQGVQEIIAALRV